MKEEGGAVMASAISVPAGAHVTIELVNADADMAHGLVITAAGAARSQMPMMTAVPGHAQKGMAGAFTIR
jgi:uncharacterized cupredoxin-like copper-binding protein